MFFFSFFNLVENILYFPWLWILVFHHYYSIHSYLLFKYQISFIFSNLSNSLIRYALEYHTLFFTLLFLLHNFLSASLHWILDNFLRSFNSLQLSSVFSSNNFFISMFMGYIFKFFLLYFYISLVNFLFMFFYLFFVCFLIFYFQNENLITFYCFLFNYFYYLFYTLLSEVL